MTSNLSLAGLSKTIRETAVVRLGGTNNTWLESLWPATTSGGLSGRTLSSSEAASTGKQRRLVSMAAHILPTGNPQQASGGNFMLCDRLWETSPMAFSGTDIAINSVPWPERCPPASGDPNAPPDNLGNGVLIGLETVQTITPTASRDLMEVRYTDSDGVARTWTRPWVFAVFLSTSFPGSKTFRFFPVANVRSVQSIRWDGNANSTYSLVAFRILGSMLIPTFAGGRVDWAALGLPRIYDGTAPFAMFRMFQGSFATSGIHMFYQTADV